MDKIAEAYVKLTLAVGQHDPNYVDAYYGPFEWKAEATQPASLEEIAARVESLRGELGSSAPSDVEGIERQRWQYLAKQLEAMQARVEMLQGVERTFDEESAALYDVVAPVREDAFYEAALADLEGRLPGAGDLSARYERFRQDFLIPRDRLESAFRAAVEASRARTKQFIPLPEGEDFRIEYVTGEVWSAYNWYQGGAHSLIQVNTDFPTPIGGALGLACHEGYPGHHVYNALLERHLVRERNWTEFSVYALYSPQSLIAEGTAEYGVDLNFPREESLAFARETLYPLAGLDPARAEEYAEVQDLMGRLGYAANDAARRYLDGMATHGETVDWLVRYTLSTPERAAQRIRFFEAHRSYVVTYNVGEDLVRDYVESRASSPEERWAVFADLLSTPQVPSALRT
ncbi:MAG: hypothetical protein ACO1SV_26425 [Fimbriimonas sp.]